MSQSNSCEKKNSYKIENFHYRGEMRLSKCIKFCIYAQVCGDAIKTDLMPYNNGIFPGEIKIWLSYGMGPTLSKWEGKKKKKKKKLWNILNRKSVLKDNWSIASK